jgi:hypothetical protein
VDILWVSCGVFWGTARDGGILNVAAWVWEEFGKGGRRAYPWREGLKCGWIRQKVTSSVRVLVIEE